MLDQGNKFHFHVVYGETVMYDQDGQRFVEFEAARYYALGAIRHFFLAHPTPRHPLMLKSMLCITREDGDIVEVVPFLDAFATDDAVSVIRCQAGHA